MADYYTEFNRLSAAQKTIQKKELPSMERMVCFITRKHRPI